MTEVKAVAPTPGPWREGQDGNMRVYGPDAQGDDSGLIAEVFKNGRANARLIAAAPDHALFGRAIAARLIRWEPFVVGLDRGGEICCNGLRYSTTLDDFGVPRLPDPLRAFLATAEGTTP